MRQAARMGVLAALLALATLAASAPGQSPLTEAAEAELSERAGIPRDQLATLRVADEPDRLIMAFVATTEAVLDSDLTARLKDGIRPFLEEDALLVLVYSIQRSRFDPAEISFAQNNRRLLLSPDRIHPITSNFRAGSLPAETLSAGVITLPDALDPDSAFEIIVRDRFRTTFEPQSASDPESGPSGSSAGAVARQNGTSFRLSPLEAEGSQTLEALYRYEGFRSHSSLVSSRASVLFLYDDPTEGRTLGMIHHSRQPGSAQFTFWGLPEAARFVLQDDPDDAYWLAPPSGKATWRWSSTQTDGGVLAGLDEGAELTVRPDFSEGVERWLLVRGSLPDPDIAELPAPDRPLHLTIPARSDESEGDEGEGDEEEDDEGASNDPPSESPDEEGAAPVAAFTLEPHTPQVGETVTLDASASRAPDGSIVRYAWDLDGDGTMERRSRDPVAEHTFAQSGSTTVTLRVHDTQGRRSEASRTVRVRSMSAPVTVERAIAALLPDAEALPGSTFHVELRIRAHRRVVGLGVRERPPEGWALSPVANDGADYNPDTREWVFTEPLESGEARTLRYRITVPARAQPGSYAFTGEFVAGVPDYQAEIGGNREAHVVLALPIPVAVSRLDANGEIDLRRSNRITFDQILQATALWKRQAPVPGTDGRQIDLSLLVTLIAHWRTGTPVDEPLPGEAE